MKEMKAYFTYSGSSGWYHCVLVLENGWAPFGHLCSHPNFAPGDLWYGRPERQRILSRMGLKLEFHSEIIRDTDVPKEVLERNKAGGFEDLRTAYERAEAEEVA